MRRVVLLAALAAALVLTQRRIDGALGAFRVQDESLYLWSGAHVKRMAAGFENLAADIYWLRTVQYFGGQRLFAQGKRFELLHPLIDVATTLDPRLEVAYRYGAIFLCEPPPIGAGRVDQGLALLERGSENLPLSWRLRQDEGYFRFLFQHDAPGAARVLEEASRIPGAAFWLKMLAADLLTKGGDRATARAMWQRMYEQAEEGIIKANAQVRLQVLDAEDGADRVTAQAQEFQRRAGRWPRSLGELQASGLARGPVVDPAGVPYDYDPQTGRATVSRRSMLWRAQ
jgi:hypothetical protein